MIHSNLERVVLGVIGETEEAEGLKRSLGESERVVDHIANKVDMNLADVLNETRILLERRSSHTYISKIWSKVEDDLKSNLRALEK